MSAPGARHDARASVAVKANRSEAKVKRGESRAAGTSAKTRSRPRERGKAKARSARLRARVAADTPTLLNTHCCNEAAGGARLLGGRLAVAWDVESVQRGRA